jgi:WD40 repeat protein
VKVRLVFASIIVACGGVGDTPKPPNAVTLGTVTPPTPVTPEPSVHAVAQTASRSDIWAIAWSPKGDLVATGSFDHTIRVWNDEGVLLAVLRGHREALKNLEFSPRGDVLASTARDGTLRLWDLHHAGKHRKIDHSGDHLAFDAAGEHVVTVGYDLHARIWNVATGALDRTLEAPRGRQLRAVAWHGDTIAAVSLDGQIYTWSTKTGVMSQGVAPYPDAVQFSPDGSVLAVTSYAQHAVWVFDPATLARRELKHADVTPSALCFTSDGKTLVTNGTFGELHVWNVASGAHQRVIAHPGYIEAVACSPRGSTVIAGGKVPTVAHVEVPVTRAYDVASGHETMRLEGKTRAIERGAWSETGDVLMTEGEEVALWDMRTGARTSAFHPESGDVAWNPRRSLFAVVKARGVEITDGAGAPSGFVPFTGEIRTRWSPDGESLAIWNDTSVIVWSATKHTRRTITAAKARTMLSDVAFDAGGRELGVAIDQTVDAYALDTGQLARSYTLTGHAASWSRVESFAWGPRGELAATLSGPGAVVFDGTGAFRDSLADRSWFALPAFSRDGATLAYTVKHDIVLRGSQTAVFHGHDDVVRSVAWSPDGRTLASSSDDQTIRVWRPGKSEPSITFDTYDGRVWTVQWHPRGHGLLGVGNEMLMHRLEGRRTIHMVVAGASAAWFTEDGAWFGDEKALASVVLRTSDDLLDPKLDPKRWKRDDTLLAF